MSGAGQPRHTAVALLYYAVVYEEILPKNLTALT
jgi:hypothetical protein